MQREKWYFIGIPLDSNSKIPYLPLCFEGQHYIPDFHGFPNEFSDLFAIFFFSLCPVFFILSPG
jgi:hypothetical protein